MIKTLKASLHQTFIILKLMNILIKLKFNILDFGLIKNLCSQLIAINYKLYKKKTTRASHQ